MLTDYFEPFTLLKSASCPDPYGGQLQQDVTEQPFRAALADALGEEGERGGKPFIRVTPYLLCAPETPLKLDDIIRRREGRRALPRLLPPGGQANAAVRGFPLRRGALGENGGGRMTLLRALVSRFSALLGDVYYEGTVPSDAPYPYAVVSAKIPAAFGGTGEITLCCYERGGDSHTRIAEKMARVMRFSGSLVHYGGGLALLQSPQCAIGHEKGGITVLRMTMAFTHYPNQCYSLRKEEFLC